MLFNMSDRHRNMPLLLFACIGEEGYAHPKQGYRATKKRCQRLCDNIRCPCQHHQGCCQQPEIKFAGMPEIEHHSLGIRRRSRSVWYLCLLRGDGSRLGCCRCALMCRSCIVAFRKTSDQRLRGNVLGMRRLALTITDNIQAHAGQRKGSQQPKGVQISKNYDSAMYHDKHTDGYSNGEENREMRRAP